MIEMHGIVIETYLIPFNGKVCNVRMFIYNTSRYYFVCAHFIRVSSLSIFKYRTHNYFHLT